MTSEFDKGIIEFVAFISDCSKVFMCFENNLLKEIKPNEIKNGYIFLNGAENIISIYLELYFPNEQMIGWYISIKYKDELWAVESSISLWDDELFQKEFSFNNFKEIIDQMPEIQDELLNVMDIKKVKEVLSLENGVRSKH